MDEPTAIAIDLRCSLEHVRRIYTREVLRLNGGNLTQTARKLGIHRKTLQTNLKQWSTSCNNCGSFMPQQTRGTVGPEELICNSCAGVKDE